MAKVDFITTSLVTTNRVKIAIYEEPDRLTVIDSQIYASPHPVRTWTFTNLTAGTNYYLKWTEIDGSGADIRTIGFANFTADVNSIKVRPSENIIVDQTLGLTAGETVATFDGTGGKLDFGGWEIIPVEIGTGPLQKDVDYSWNSTTGTLTLLLSAFVHDVRYFIQFEPQTTTVSGQVFVKDAWKENFYVNGDTTLTADQFGSNAIIKGASGHLKITLPDIFGVTPNRLLYVDSTDGNHKCAEIACSSATGNANLLMWPKASLGSIFMCPNETLAIYREKVDNTTSYWRVKYPDGNFKTVGEIIPEFASISNVSNKVALDGSVLNNLEYARLYQYVLNLPGAEVVTYAAWSTGDNKYKFSLADGSGNFHVPDLRSKYMRQIDTGEIPGTYQTSQNKQHDHVMHGKGSIGGGGGPFFLGTATSNYSGGGGDGFGRASGHTPDTNMRTGDSGGDVARPETVLVNVYIRC